MNERKKGEIIIYKDLKGYGFVRDESMHDEFFHFSDCKGFTPTTGDSVIYDIGTDRQGRTKAINIERKEEIE